ncbi:MAG: sulfatase-like hydrolase/transferase [Planctomycetales bacterium]|nr:sulfatase-like hydrolase/transferase [Planctomycetales bacterium]
MARIYLLPALWLALLIMPCPVSGQESRQPHVLFIVADDLRGDVMSVHGGPVPTPNLDRLAASGSLFSRATCGYPICHVSRSEMLSGRVLEAEATVSRKPVLFQPEWKLWPDVMREAGWHTVYVGKWHVRGTPWTRGYAETFGLYSAGGGRGAPVTLPHSSNGSPVTGYTGWTFKTNDNKPLLERGIGLMPDTDALIADGALEALAARADKPLFLHVNFTAPHDPLHWPQGLEDKWAAESIELPSNFRQEHPFPHGNEGSRDEIIVPAPRTAQAVRRERAVYYALVENIDTQVGRILQAIEPLGGLDNTLVIFTSDHGLALGSHGLMGKQNQYEHTANVPLIIAGPGIPANQRLQAQCALRDLFPTTCDLLQLSIPSTVQGKSLMPVLRGEQSEVHEAVFGYFTDTQRMIRTADGWKLIRYPQVNRTQMFHVAEDPQELNDLASASEHQAQRQRLEAALDKWLSER